MCREVKGVANGPSGNEARRTTEEATRMRTVSDGAVTGMKNEATGEIWTRGLLYAANDHYVHLSDATNDIQR